MKGRVRWLRILAGIAVILFLGLPCLVGAIVVAVGGNVYLRNGAVADGRRAGHAHLRVRPASATSSH